MTHATILSNRYLRAAFDPSGNLISLRRSDRDAELLAAVYCWHSDGTTKFTEQRDGFEPVRISTDERVVDSTIRSPMVEVQRRFELRRDQPLLAVSYVVRPVNGTTRLAHLAFPQLEFASDFADPFEDDRDEYDDGAELGDGREMPGWRAFFRKDSPDGLIFAARRKRDCSRLQIRVNGFEIFPHVSAAYNVNAGSERQPMEFGKTKSYEVYFELGPWSRASHAKIIRAARLNKPVEADNPPPRGRFPRLGPGRIFHAASFASPAGVSDRLTKTKWLKLRLPWAHKGRALFAGTGVRPPALSLDPKLKGLHRVFVGIGNGAGVVLRARQFPEPIFRLNPRYDGTAFDLRLSGRQTACEVDCGVMQMDGCRIRLERFPDVHKVCMIDYVRCQRLGAAQARQWQQRQRNPARVALSGFNDVPDISPMTDVRHPSPSAYTANIWEHARCGFKRIYWRIDGQCTDYPTKIGTQRYVSAKVHGVFDAQAKAYGRATRKFDMLRTALDAARKYGVELYGWMRFNAYFGNVVSDFYRNNPQFWEVWAPGKLPSRKLCLAFPEVRKHKIDIVVEAAGYGLAGVNLGFLRHPPVLMYHPILVEGYQKQFGRLPPPPYSMDDTTYRRALPESSDEHQQWYQYRAGFMTLFGRELRAALRLAKLAHVKVSIWVRPNHCLFDGIDIEAWLNEGLCDEVVCDVETSTDLSNPMFQPTPQWKQMVQSKVPIVRGISQFDFKQSKKMVPQIIDEGYDGICTYESDYAVLDTRFINLYQSLRRVSA